MRLTLSVTVVLVWLAGRPPAQGPRDVRVSMRDGKSLAADLFLPEAGGAFPCILIQTPYGRRRFRPLLDAAEKGRSSLSGAVSLPLDRAHYAYLVVDWRGRGGSRRAAAGKRVPGKQRGEDGYDCVEWAARQEWCDGKVGTWGGSALGKQQFQTAAERPPHLVCCVPLIASMGQKYASYYPGGVLREGHVAVLDFLGFGAGRLVRQFPYGGQLAWKIAERSSLRPQEVAVPMLLVTGWWDIEPGLVVDTFDQLVARGGERTRAHSRLIIGPWDHMGVGGARSGEMRFDAAAGFAAKAALGFLDRWLRGHGVEEEAALPRCTWFDVGAGPGGGAWRGSAAWPPAGGAEPVLWLDPSGALARRPPRAGAWRRVRSDPRKPVPTLGGGNLRPLPAGPTDHRRLEGRPDVLVWSTGKLGAELRIRGRPVLVVACRANRVDFDLCARLCVASPGGPSLLLADGIRRASFVAGARAPRRLEKGKTLVLRVELGPVGATIAAGDELRLYVSETNWRRFERNPHTGAAHWDRARALDCEVGVLAGPQTHLALPVAAKGR